MTMPDQTSPALPPGRRGQSPVVVLVWLAIGLAGAAGGIWADGLRDQGQEAPVAAFVVIGLCGMTAALMEGLIARRTSLVMSVEVAAALGVLAGVLVAIEGQPSPPPEGYVWVPAGVIEHVDPVTGEATRLLQPRPLWVKRHEVTAQEYAALRGRPGAFERCPSCPIEAVSWRDATRFADLASRAASRRTCYGGDGVLERCPGYRLPTVDEWRYIAALGAKRAEGGSRREETVSGSLNDVLGVAAARTVGGGTAGYPVDQDVEDGIGLVGVHTNVVEWCDGPVPRSPSVRPAIRRPKPVCGPSTMSPMAPSGRLPWTSSAESEERQVGRGFRLVRAAPVSVEMKAHLQMTYGQ